MISPEQLKKLIEKDLDKLKPAIKKVGPIKLPVVLPRGETGNPDNDVLNEKQKKILKDLRGYPLPPPSIIKARQSAELKRFETERNKEMENALKRFAKQITDEFNVNCPEVIAIPKALLIQVTDSGTDSTYHDSSEVIYMSIEDSVMRDFCHELKHHIDFKQKGIEHVIEFLRCQFLGIYAECPTEERAAKFAFNCVKNEKYRKDWREKVEPVIGSRRIVWAQLERER